MGDEPGEPEPSTVGVDFLPFPERDPGLASFVEWLNHVALFYYGLTREELGADKWRLP